MARIFLCLANAAAIGRHCRRHHLPPSSGGYRSACLNRHVVGTWGGGYPRSSNFDENESLPFVLHLLLAPLKGIPFLMGAVISGSCLLPPPLEILRHFCAA